jgi:dolichol-phosphate mannosyltransferase
MGSRETSDTARAFNRRQFAISETVAAAEPRIAVVLPCYMVAGQLEKVLNSIPDSVERIVVVDDCCPQKSYEIGNRLARMDERITVLRHDENSGVGGSVIDGYRKALELGADIIVKMDADGQMDVKDMPALIDCIVHGRADYAKGNRFLKFDDVGTMPKWRLFGNSVLSFAMKAVSGYWNITDPTNGYTAIRREVLEKLNLDQISKRYFFESDMLIQLNLIGAIVEDTPMKTFYGDEHSSLNIWKVMAEFPFKLLRRLARRIFLKYFIYDFNMGSVYILIGVPMFLFGFIYGAAEWLDSIITNTAKPAGTIMLAALPIIMGFQMLLQAIQIDIERTPKKRFSDQ